MKTWLLFDVSYLAYRAFYSTGQLSYDDVPTGVLYGVFSEVLRTMERFQEWNVVFCFDVGRPKRVKLLPTYKQGRRKAEYTDEEQRARKEIKAQLDGLREDILPYIGFKNIFWAKGYEADDLIATTVLGLEENEDAIMISNDQDLYQLLGPRCEMWELGKKQYLNAKKFQQRYGIKPEQWVEVKAIAGCTSDNVPGIQGVGEKTAIKYLRGELKGKARNKIVMNDDWPENRKLVRLPFRGCPTFEKRPDEVTKKRWQEAMKDFGFSSLINDVPIPG